MAPMFLCCEIDDEPRPEHVVTLGDEYPARLKLALLADRLVSFVVLGKILLEHQSNTFAANPDSIDGVNERFGFCD